MVLVGLRAGGDRGWAWSDQSVTSYLNWDKGEPNNGYGMESCVTLKSNGKWNDIPCNFKIPYICKQNDGKRICLFV